MSKPLLVCFSLKKVGFHISTAETSSSTPACGFDPWGKNLINGDFVAEAGIALLNHYEGVEKGELFIIITILASRGKRMGRNYFSQRNM